jgi:hypothetical protein
VLRDNVENYPGSVEKDEALAWGGAEYGVKAVIPWYQDVY